MTVYKIHPLAEIFPPFTDQEFKELVKDIGQNGQRNVITLYEGKILDGWNRYKACIELHMDPRVRSYTGNDPLGFVISANLKRRHLNESQRALIAAELSANKNGRSKPDRTKFGTLTNKSAAQALNVSEHSVDTAKSVLKNAPKQELEAVRAGTKTVSGVKRELSKKRAGLTDTFGRTVPDEIIADWNRAKEQGEEAIALARKIKKICKVGFPNENDEKPKDIIFRELDNTILSDAHNLAWRLKKIVPYCVCTTCQGMNRKNCATCRGRGFFSKDYYEGPGVSADVRKLIER